MPHTKRVFDNIEANIDWLKERAGNPRSLLYVGWRHDCKPWWHDTLCPALGIEKIGVLEIFPKNHSDLEQAVWSGRYNVNPVLGDACHIDKTTISRHEYDIIFWDHGPEHVTESDLNVVTPLLADWAGRLLLYCCPWGDWPQGAEDGNDHEIHRNAVTEKQLVDLGMNVKTFARPGQHGEGELLAFKFVNGFKFE